jgi:hypothetical protein
LQLTPEIEKLSCLFGQSLTNLRRFAFALGYRLKVSFQMGPAELPPSLRQLIVGVVAICDHNRFGSFADHLLGLRCPATRQHAKDRHRMRCQKP